MESMSTLWDTLVSLECQNDQNVLVSYKKHFWIHTWVFIIIIIIPL